MANIQPNLAGSSGSGQSHSARKTVLGDRYMVGEELGRGAYGQVFKGMDTKNGESVAIKQISLQGVSQDNLHSIMGEIELLKTLKHKNIVKYMGSYKTRSHLYIILEFMENGSLSSVIKPNRFGVFPETLIAVYIAQVLHGLQYLHQQGVVHRDIKGANILTTKEGVVKLADFGVAAKLGELEELRDDMQHQNVVGTPYWMAPEVIEMTQVTAASDIWSVGCLIIELLTGYPPYFDLQPMSALFRIVQDELPPLPDNITSLLADFLVVCFQKDPKRRPDASTLLRHEWIAHNRRTLKTSWGKSMGLKAQATYKPEVYAPVSVVVERILRLEGDPVASKSDVVLDGEDLTRATDLNPSSPPLTSTSSPSSNASCSITAVSTPRHPTATHASLPPELNHLESPHMPEATRSDWLRASDHPAPSSQQPALSSRHPSLSPKVQPMSAAHQHAAKAQVKAVMEQRQPQEPPQWWHSSQHYHSNAQPQPPLHDQLPSAPSSEPPQLPYTSAELPLSHSSGQPRMHAACSENTFSPTAPGGQRPRRLLGDPSAAHAAWASSYTAAAQPPPTQQLPGQPASMNHSSSSPDVGSYSQQPPRLGSLHSASSLGMEMASERLSESVPVSRSRTFGHDQVVGSVGLGRSREHEGGLESMREDALSPSRFRLTRSLEDMGRPPLHPRSPNMPPTDVRASAGDADGLAAAQARLLPVRTISASSEAYHPKLLGDMSDTGLATLLRRLQGDSPSTPPGACIMSWLEHQPQAERPYSEVFSRSRSLTGLKTSMSLSGAHVGGLQLDDAHDGSDTMELKKQLRQLVRSMRPNAKEGVIAPMDACSIVASMFARQPEAAVHFYSEDGLLVLLELLESDDVKYQEGAMELLASLCAAAEPQISHILEAICLRGMVPAIGRMLTVGSHQLRTRSAFVVNKMVHSHPSILQLFVAGGGLQHLVRMLQHEYLADLAGLQLAMQGIVCVQKVMEINFVLPVGHVLRLMSQYGLAQRLSLVLYKLMYLRHRQSFRQHGRENSIASMSDLHSPLGTRELLDPETRSIPSVTHSRSASSMTDRPLLLEYGRSSRAAERKAMSGSMPGAQIETDFLLSRVIDMLLIMSCGDPVVKQFVCSKQNLQCMLDSLQRMHSPFLMRLMHCIRNLTSEPSVINALQEAGTIAVLVPFLGPARAKEGLDVQVEALAALYNICRPNKRIHLELAANDHIVPHLCRFATQANKATEILKQRLQSQPSEDALREEELCMLEEEQGLRQRALQSYVVPMLIGMVSASPRTRAKLWGSNGPDTFLSLLITQEPQLQVVVMRALDTWLSEDITRMESRLSMAASVNAIVAAFAQQCADSNNLTQLLDMLECLKQMVARSPKLVVAVTHAGIVKHLKSILQNTPPFVRARALELIRCLYQHQPRPKEFIMMYKLQETLRQLHLGNGLGDEMVKQEAQKLLQAFNVNSLL